MDPYVRLTLFDPERGATEAFRTTVQVLSRLSPCQESSLVPLLHFPVNLVMMELHKWTRCCPPAGMPYQVKCRKQVNDATPRWNEKFDFIDIPASSFLTATIYDKASLIESRKLLKPWQSVCPFAALAHAAVRPLNLKLLLVPNESISFLIVSVCTSAIRTHCFGSSGGRWVTYSAL